MELTSTRTTAFVLCPQAKSFITRDNSFIPHHTLSPQRPCSTIKPIKVSRSRLIVRNSTSSFTEDFFAGPSTPPRPRPLYKVMLYSITTNLLWYGYYKYCIEEELLKKTGSGPGAIGALGPFMLGITSPLYLPHGLPANAGVAAGLLWIVMIQYSLYKRINQLSTSVDSIQTQPLTPWWVVIPGFNLIVGLRSIHFLSVAFGADPEEDPVVEKFPFLGIEQLGLMQMLTTPSLWLKW